MDGEHTADRVLHRAVARGGERGVFVFVAVVYSDAQGVRAGGVLFHFGGVRFRPMERQNHRHVERGDDRMFHRGVGRGARDGVWFGVHADGGNRRGV